MHFQGYGLADIPVNLQSLLQHSCLEGGTEQGLTSRVECRTHEFVEKLNIHGAERQTDGGKADQTPRRDRL